MTRLLLTLKFPDFGNGKKVHSIPFHLICLPAFTRSCQLGLFPFLLGFPFATRRVLAPRPQTCLSVGPIRRQGLNRLAWISLMWMHCDYLVEPYDKLSTLTSFQQCVNTGRRVLHGGPFTFLVSHCHFLSASVGPSSLICGLIWNMFEDLYEMYSVNSGGY